MEDRDMYSILKIKAFELEKGTKSNIRTGLVIQGGGMRGVYSMAALMALEECGLSNSFDHVFGSSAGGINGAYMLGGQAKQAVTVYLDDISNKKFVNFLRLKKIVDIDYLIDGVLNKRKHLNIESVINSKSVLHLILTEFSTGKKHVVTNKDENISLMEVFRATSAMPILYNKVISINGKGYVDGGLRDGLPLLQAIDYGCTDIVVVLTRPPVFRRRRPNFLMRNVEKLFLKNYPEVTRSLILSEDGHFNKTMDILDNPNEIGYPGKILVVYPSDMKKMVSRTTKNRRKLLECALMARNDMRQALGLEPKFDNPWT